MTDTAARNRERLIVVDWFKTKDDLYSPIIIRKIVKLIISQLPEARRHATQSVLKPIQVSQLNSGAFLAGILTLIPGNRSFLSW